MTKEQFTAYMKSLTSKAAKIRAEKEEEYFNTSDILASFRKIASFRDTDTPAAIMNLMSNQLQSISDMVNAEPSLVDKTPVEKWDAKFVDTLNYLFKLYAAIREKR